MAKKKLSEISFFSSGSRYTTTQLQAEHSYATIVEVEEDAAAHTAPSTSAIPDGPAVASSADVCQEEDKSLDWVECTPEVSFNLEDEESCHECIIKDGQIKGLQNELEKLRKELTIQRRERENQRVRILQIEAGFSFFRDDQLNFLKKKNNLRGYTWSKETLRDALKIRFSCKCSKTAFSIDLV